MTDLMKLSKMIRDLGPDILYIATSLRQVEVKDARVYGIDVMEEDCGYYIVYYFYVDGVKFYSTNFKSRGLDNDYLD